MAFDQRYQPGAIPQFGSFGPPNMSAQLQAGISKLADPFIARLRELQIANEAAAQRKDTESIFKPTPTAATGAPGAAAQPRAPGVLGTPAEPFVNPGAARGAGGGSFAMGQGMDPSTGEPTPGGVGTVAASPLLEAAKIGIAGVESGGTENPYVIKGKTLANGNYANGKYQVMATNVGPWTEKWLGQRLTPDEFRASPEAQERVFEGEFGSYLDKYGNLKDAASKWFSGRSFKDAVAAGAKDININVPEYVRRVYAHIQKAGGVPTAQPTTAPTASFAPSVAPAPTPAAQAAVAAPASPIGPLPRREGPPLPVNAPQAAGANAAPVQVASLDSSIGIGQRQAAPEVAPRPVRTQSVGPDGQPLPPQQQPAPALPSGPPPNEQPPPPPPPPVQPPPPPIPAVAPVEPPPPAPMAALPTSAAPPAPRVAPAVTPPPEQPVAAGVPQPPVRTAQAAPQQQAPQRYIAPVDPVAERYWLTQLRHAKTHEQVVAAGQKLMELRQGQKPSVHITPQGLVEYRPDQGTARFLTHSPDRAPKTAKGPDGRDYAWNEDTQRYDRPVGGDAPAGFREMSPEERRKFAVPENTGAFIGPDGKPHVLPGTSSTKITVTPEAKGEEKYNEEQAKSLRKRFDTIVEEGDKAARTKIDLNSLSEVFARTGPQGTAANFKTTVGPYLEALGINVAGLSDAQVVQSVIERMAPQQRVVGSGQQSDAEYKGFLRSLPTLMQSPEARQRVLSLLQAQNDIAVRKAEIIADHDEGNIDRKTAMQQIRALPDHKKVYEKFKAENNDLFLKGQRDAAARKDTGNPTDLRAVQEQNRAPAQPRTQAEYEALEPGRKYIDPKDGKVYTKGISR